MVVSLCCFSRKGRPNGSLSEKASENENNELVDEPMKPRSLLDAMKVERRLERKQDVQLWINKCKVITLEDLIVSSPAFNTTDDCMSVSSGGEPPMPKQSSRKIHPSFDGDIKQSLLPVSKDGLLEAGSSSFCRSYKKVRFRSPEVADVFELHHSPESNIYIRATT